MAFSITSCNNDVNKNSQEGNEKNNIKKSDHPQLEPLFRHDGTLWAINDGDTTAEFRTEFAKSNDQIQRGMMYRSSMDQDMAMLFFMPGGDKMQSFWMKNTIVPLDIIYINNDHQVVSIQANAKPFSTQSLPSVLPASYVLEIYGGEAAAQGIVVGTKVDWSDK